MKKILMIVLTGALILGGCSDRATMTRQGGIALKVEVDHSVVDGTSSRSSLDDFLGTYSADQLKIKLEQPSGKYVFQYDSFDELPTEYEFPIGDYNVTASIGDVDIEGIDQPAFVGTTTIEVFENQSTAISLTAKLANCVLKVEYSDRFKEYMTSYYSQLNSSSGNTFNIPMDDDSNLFFKPGSTSVTVGFVKPDGTSGQYTVPQFDAKAQRLYRVQLDINNESGVAFLNVKYNDETIPVPTPIDLSKDLSVIPVPYMIARGFDAKSLVPVDFIENLPFNEELDMQIVAMAGLQSVKLYTESQALCLESTVEGLRFPKEIELMGASEDDKALLKWFGLEVQGLWTNPDRMGIIDFSSILKSIRYIENELTTFRVEVTDLLGRKSQPMTLRLNPIKLTLELTSTNGTEYALGMYDNIAHVHVLYNGGVQFADQLRFEYADKNGNWITTKVVEIRQTPASMNPTGSQYRLCALIEVPSGSENVRVHAHCGTTVSNEIEFKRVGGFMYFEEDYDEAGLNTFATSAKVHMLCGSIDQSTIEVFARKKGENDTQWRKVTSTPVNTGDIAPFITVSGLEPNTEYELKAQAKEVKDGAEGRLLETEKVFAIHTEEALQLPNGNMDSWYRDPGMTNYWWVDYPGNNMDETVWGTMNQLTTSIGDGRTTMFNHHGTSYCAFSGTRSEAGRRNNENPSDYCAIISTVGWGDNDANGGTTTGKGCKKITVGELYLTGSCDVSSEKAVYDKYNFTSRPRGLKFWYKYVPKNSEDYGVAEIEVFDANGNSIAKSETFNPRSASGWTESSVIALTYRSDCPKAGYIQVKFKSSGNTACQTINTTNLSCPALGNLSDGRFTGSEMYIDDIELVY